MSGLTKDTFRATFDPKRSQIERDLAWLPNVSKTQIRAAVDDLVQRIQLLEKSVTDNINIITPFDARICLEAVKAASENLSELRGRLIPRPKFSFKSRKTVANPTSPSSLQVASVTANDTSAAVASTIDTSLFMTFENRAGEYLFIGDLQVPTATSVSNIQADANGGPIALVEDGEPIYLGGVQVELAVAPDTIEKPKDVALTNLTDCTINLVHTLPLGAIHIKNLKRCVLVIPPVSGSILLHDCEGCTLVGACHQSRMHTSTNMDIYLHVTSEPIIEDCTDMRFAPYPYQEVLPSDQLLALFVAAGLRPEMNLFDHVKDFNWLRQQQSPNWRLLEASEIRQGITHHVLYTQRV